MVVSPYRRGAARAGRVRDRVPDSGGPVRRSSAVALRPGRAVRAQAGQERSVRLLKGIGDAADGGTGLSGELPEFERMPGS